MPKHVGRQFKRIHMIMDYNFNSVVARYDLTTAQADMLILLFHNKGTPMCQKDIEERLGLKNPTVTGTLKRLEAKGFIKRVPLESDHRFNQITPTPRARLVQRHGHKERPVPGRAHGGRQGCGYNRGADFKAGH